jgi:hypothetical protein
MDALEISLAQAYLAASGQDPVTALIRSVKDLARVRRMLIADEADSAAAPSWAGQGAYAATPAIAGVWPSSCATSPRIS